MATSDINTEKTPVPVGNLENVLVEKIRANPRNPRQTFRPATIERLAASMEEIGLQVPITVYKVGGSDEYVLLDGERRFRASRHINWITIPALVVSEPSTNENAVRMFNIHMLREEWEEIETAWALEQIIAETGEKTDRELQKITGLTIDRIRNMRRVLSYPKDVQERVASGKLKYQLLVELDKNVSAKFRRDISESSDVAVPGMTAESAREIFLNRYETDVEADVVDLRRVGTLIDTARGEGKVGERARGALQRLFSEPSLTIEEAYELGAASNVELGKVLRDIASLPSRISDFLSITLDKDQRSQVKEALLQLQSRLESEIHKLG